MSKKRGVVYPLWKKDAPMRKERFFALLLFLISILLFVSLAMLRTFLQLSVSSWFGYGSVAIFAFTSWRLQYVTIVATKRLKELL